MGICLTLAERTPAELQRKIARYTDEVPYIEVRLDYLDSPVVPPLPQDTFTQFIATCRPTREGGAYRGEEQDRLDILKKASHDGCAWVDLESDVEEVTLAPSTRILRSFHTFDSFPNDLTQVFRNLRRAGGEVFKLAVPVRTTLELVTLLKWIESQIDNTRFVIVGMGEMGQPSRLLGEFLGNEWTYVAEQKASSVAAGQPTLQEARQWYRFGSFPKPPDIYGVLGNPVKHSLSPLLHNCLFNQHGLEKVYFPFPLDDVDAWLEYVRGSRLNFQGFSVTLPFKTDVLKHANFRNSPVGSLNTLVRRNSHWEGFNTDYQGFLQPLKSVFELKSASALVLGNGGVAHTVVKALLDESAEVRVVGRNPEKVSRFAKPYGCPHALFCDLPIEADLCVNTTPVGQFPNAESSPLEEEHLRFRLVYDLVYHPERTRLLQMARANGIQTLSGMEMFVEQAALQFHKWTGISPEREGMKEIIRSVLKRQGGNRQE